jgi:Holliday junction resolvase
MVHSYRKGYLLEWKLQHKLFDMGYAVMRAPRSGRIGLPTPDLVAIKDGKIIVIECKSREDAFTVDAEQLKELQEWEKRAGATAYIAWKMSRREPLFLRLKDVLATNGNIGKKMLEEKGIGIDEI